MSFGYLDASKPTYYAARASSKSRTSARSSLAYKVTPTLRYQDDKDNGAVTMTVSTVERHRSDPYRIDERQR